jgi:excisionase family DNA binding protein
MDERWLSAKEICEYLGVGRSTVYKWIERHDLPAHKVSRLWKFRKEEVDEWIKNEQATPSTVKASSQEV